MKRQLVFRLCAFGTGITTGSCQSREILSRLADTGGVTVQHPIIGQGTPVLLHAQTQIRLLAANRTRSVPQQQPANYVAAYARPGMPVFGVDGDRSAGPLLGGEERLSRAEESK